eukprot:360225-Pleurochrysis_carterae.AAC.1
MRAFCVGTNACPPSLQICGVLGESNRMTDNERATLISAAVEVAREVSATPPSSPPLAPCDVPTPPPTPPQSSPSSKGPFRVCVGTSHAGTAATVALSQMAQQLGAAAVMVTPSKEPTPVSADTMVEYYRRVGKGCPGLPIVLQDHPASTQEVVLLLSDAYERARLECKHMIGKYLHLPAHEWKLRVDYR